MASASELLVTSYASDDLEKQREVLLDVYEEVYRDHLDDPFFSVPRYWQRLVGYASRLGFGMTIGRIDDEPVGYALGYTLPVGSGWWRGLQSDVGEGELREDGNRTFALTEIMVREPWRRRGYARRLHDSLLANRNEQRATLLVLPDNTPAKAAYVAWGWRRLGQLKPFNDAPTYDAMVLALPADPRTRD